MNASQPMTPAARHRRRRRAASPLQAIAAAGIVAAAGIAAALAPLAPAPAAAAAAATAAQDIAAPISILTADGLDVWFVERREVPVVAVNMAFSRGAAADPADKRGVANLLAAILDDGPAAMPLAEYRRRLNAMAASIGYSASLTHFRLSLFSLTANLDVAVELMRRTLNDPRLDAESLDRNRRQILAAMIRERENPQDRAVKLWFKTAFPDHPFGQPRKGDPASLESIGRRDLQDWLKHNAARDRLHIVIVGDLSRNEAKNLAQRLTQALPAKAKTAEIAPAQPDIPDPNPVIEAFNGAQAVIRFGATAPGRQDPDFIPAFVAAHILGGGTLSSRLDAAIRIESGFAYSVYAYLNPIREAPFYFGGFETAPQNARIALDETLKTLRNFAENGASEKEVQAAKDYLIGSFPLRFGSTADTAAVLLGFRLGGLPRDYATHRNRLIAAVSRNDVNRAARRLFGGEKPLIVMLAPQPTP